MKAETVNWVRSIAQDVLIVTALYLAYHGHQWAENVLAFWVFGVMSLTAIGYMLIVIAPYSEIKKTTPTMGTESALATWDTVTGILLSVTYAAFGWFGMATVMLVATAAFATAHEAHRAARLREQEAQQA